MKVLLDAEVIAKSEGGVRLRLQTGFGNPEVLIDAARIELRDDAPDPTDDPESKPKDAAWSCEKHKTSGPSYLKCSFCADEPAAALAQPAPEKLHD